MALVIDVIPVLGGLPCGENEGLHLSPSGIDAAGSVARVPEALVHPYVSCLILLSNKHHWLFVEYMEPGFILA